MKFYNKKVKCILTKGMAFLLSVSLICGILPAIPAKAAEYTVPISGTTTSDFYSYMLLSDYDQSKHQKTKERIILMSGFLHSLNNDIPEINSDNYKSHETSKVVWNPSQEQVNDGRDLYFLQWTNGDGYSNPGDGYEILSRLVYLTTNGELRYSKQVNIDDYPRSLLDTGHKGQWDNKRINQCYFAVPDDCAQIVGLTMVNQSGGGNNNNTWWMDNLYIYRIESDKVSDICDREKNGLNHYQVSFKKGRLAAFVSDFDIDKRYLATNDKNEEWLYLLQTPDEDTQPASSGSDYYAQIITGNSDLSDKNLTLEITYTDITGKERVHTQTITDTSVKNFYPKLTFHGEFDKENDWEDNVLPLRYFNRIVGKNDPDFAIWGSYRYYLYYDTNSFANYIAAEVPKGKSAKKGVREELESYGNFHSYNWESDNTTVTNLYAFTLFGNYADYNEMNQDLLGPYTATDVKLDITYHIKSISQIKLYLKFNSESAELQDVRIYASSSDNYTRTRMNGGISTERIFYDVSDALCLASLGQEKLIQLQGNREITCSLNPAENIATSYRLVQHTDTRMTLMGEDDNLGVQISMADLYNAGFEIFMPYISESTERLPHKDYYEKPDDKAIDDDLYYKMSEVRTFLLEKLPEKTKLIESATALEILNLMESYYKDCLNLHIRYKDDLGSVRDVKVPFVTCYLMQLYSDNNGRLGTSKDNLLTGILQQGDDAGLRIPLSQYRELIDITLSFGKSTEGVSNYKNNKNYYEPDGVDPDDYYKVNWEQMWTEWDEAYTPGDKFLSRPALKEYLGETETIAGGKTIPTGETISIRAIRLYEHVTKDEFSSVYDPGKRVVKLRTTRDYDYYYESSNKRGTTFAVGSELRLSLSDGTLKRGVVDYSGADLNNTYLVELNTQSLFYIGGMASTDLFVTLSYTTFSGEEKQITAQRLSELGKDYSGGNNIGGLNVSSGYESQCAESLTAGAAYFLLELDDLSRFNYIHLSVPDGVTYGIQINSIYIYKLDSLSQRYSSPRSCAFVPLFVRDFTGTTAAFNNKAIALQPNREGSTFYFTKVNSDGTTEEPDANISYKDEYLTTPPTSMTYEETLKNLGLSITKYTYTVDVNVANVLDAGSSNYFYFQLVFENGTSGVVLANQQLASDSFRQGYTESFTINTTQNYGNVTAVRVICDTTSSTSQAFDKLNIDSITVSLPSKGGAKSWIVDKVGWIDINFQDEGVATTISADGRNGGFPNSQVVKEYAKTRTASTARLLFTVSTAATSAGGTSIATHGTFQAAIVDEDTAGYTQTYNFNLKAAIYNYMENENPYFLFKPNMSNSFTVSINDIVSVKSLNIYRNNGSGDWIIKDVSISQFSDIGEVYKSVTGEFKRYLENETLLATSTNNNLRITSAGTGTFTFGDHSISIDTAGNDPSTWTTTVTRIPATTQESLNVYLYAGSTDDRTYTFNRENIPDIKGRLEYTFKDGGSVIGSEAFAFTDSGTINGTTVLKATDIKVTGMNQLKTLHLETNSASSPIIAGARVERIRENTILETLYFDFANTEITVGKNYSTTAKADTLASPTKQILALQLSSDQEQLFTSTSDVAVALLYTSENSSSENQKMVYSSPYVFFTDVGITSLGNASILEIPFAISGADHIAGISVVSNGPIVHFENAIVYNYVENANKEKTLIDTCQIARKFNSSTVKTQLMKEENVNVTPITMTFTTSDNEKFPGAGTSGRLPLTIHYKTLTGQDETLEINNFATMLPANTLPTAGSTVSFRIQLSNFSQLTAINLNAPNDDWHLNKISAEISNITNAATTSHQREAFIDSWITSKVPVTAVFGDGNDSETNLKQIISFSITGKAGSSGNVETATSGNVLHIKALPSERITFTPLVTASGSPENTVVWDTSRFDEHMLDSGIHGLTFIVPSNSVGQIYTFTAYCSFDPEKTITISIEIVESVPPITDGGTADDSDTTDGSDDTSIVQEASVDVSISIDNSGSRQDGPAVPVFSVEDGEHQTYKIFVKPGEMIGTWTFEGDVDLSDYDVSFSPATLSIDGNAGEYNTTMSCKDSNGKELFSVTFEIIVKDLVITVSASGNGITPALAELTAASEPCTFTIPYSDTAETYTLTVTANHDGARAYFSGIGNVLTIENHQNQVPYAKGTILKTTNALCAPLGGSGQSFTIPITIKVAE